MEEFVRDRDLLIRLWRLWAKRAAELSDEQWTTETRLPGWTVRDVYVHVTPDVLIAMLAAPAAGGDAESDQRRGDAPGLQRRPGRDRTDARAARRDGAADGGRHRPRQRRPAFRFRPARCVRTARRAESRHRHPASDSGVGVARRLPRHGDHGGDRSLARRDRRRRRRRAGGDGPRSGAGRARCGTRSAGIRRGRDGAVGRPGVAGDAVRVDSLAA
ncbi:hypothetical protein GTA28_27980 [Rhodococcus hoagii]|nr:hypothetical protein [Prescottella equi]